MPTIQPLASAPVQRIIDALRGAGCEPRLNGAGWSSKCPAHDDKTPSLSISESKDGSALVHCHAGCRMEAIVTSLNLKPADLFQKNNGQRQYHRQASKVAPTDKAKTEAKARKTYKTLADAINAATYFTLRDHLDAVSKRYDYTPDYVRVRMDWNEADGQAEKTFKEISRLASGAWVLKRPSGKLPLYRVGDIDTTTMVYICEGEKPCDAGWAVGLPCTTSGASSSAGTADWRGLAGRSVVVLPDADPPGEKYAEAVVEQLLSVFPPAEVRVLRLPGLGDGEDLFEFCNVHRESRDDAAIKAEIESLADATEPEQPAPPTAETTNAGSAQFHRTDLGNAERLVRQFGHLLRFTDATGWLSWTGTHWAADRMGEVEHFATETVRAMYEEAAATQSPDAREKLGKWAASSESRRRLRDMISLAESMQPVRIRSEDLDRNQWLLNVANGTIDLKTGGLRGHDAADLISRCCPVKYDPAAKAERFEQFLREIMDGDEGMIAFLLRTLGHCLTGDTSERAIFILHGVGRNGKSTLVNLFRALLGDYARHARAETILARRNDSIPSDLARLRGARFVTVTEIEEGRRMDVARVKEMAGGGDPITARFLYQREFEFIPEFKLFIATNHRPRIRDDSEAIWDRLFLLPFGVRFEEDQVDTSLPEKLAAELPGILNLTIAGCLDWQREGGLRPPGKVLAAKTEYRTQEDTFKQWLEERCIEEDHMQTRGGTLWKDYAAWCDDCKIKPMSMRRFGERLTERFHKTKSAYVTYDGIGLRAKEVEG